MTSRSEELDYRGSHRPAGPTDDVGAPLHDVETVMPGFHDNPRIYDHQERGLSTESIAAIRAARGHPEHEVAIYRAVPKPEYGIREGDWVSTSRKYAERHAMQDDDPANDWPVIEGRAKAHELWTHGDDINEWGYHPE